MRENCFLRMCHHTVIELYIAMRNDLNVTRLTCMYQGFMQAYRRRRGADPGVRLGKNLLVFQRLSGLVKDLNFSHPKKGITVIFGGGIDCSILISLN
jgi:hypothetical protein